MSVTVQLMSGEIHSFDLCCLTWGGEPLISDLAREVAATVSFDNIGIHIPSLESRTGIYYIEKETGNFIEIDKNDTVFEGAHYYSLIKDHPKYQDVFLLFDKGEIVLKSETGQLLGKYGYKKEGLLFQPDRHMILTAKLEPEAYDQMRQDLIDIEMEDKFNEGQSYIEEEIERIKYGYKDNYIFWLFYEEFVSLKVEDIIIK
jgi:hypothetical protein